MPCLLGQPHPAFLEEEQLATIKQMAIKSKADILFDFSIISGYKINYFHPLLLFCVNEWQKN
jgi:hypothetical protein